LNVFPINDLLGRSTQAVSVSHVRYFRPEVVGDVRAPGFAAEAHRQAAAVAVGHHAADDQAFIDALSLDEA
jgi:hypothetical protein